MLHRLAILGIPDVPLSVNLLQAACRLFAQQATSALGPIWDGQETLGAALAAQVPCLNSDAMLLQLGPGPQAGIDTGDRCLQDQHLKTHNRSSIVHSQREPPH